MSVKLDAFTKVKKAMDEMLKHLKAEHADEVEHRDFCLAELDKNEDMTKDKKYEQENLLSEMDDLQAAIERAQEEIERLTEEIAQEHQDLKLAGEERAS